MNNSITLFRSKIKQDRPMERLMVEKVFQILESRVRFAAEAPPNETKNHHLRETGDHTRLQA